MTELLLPAEPLSAFVARTRDLYTLPVVATKVLELTASPNVDVRALKACIEIDPALTARLLRVVNSSLFGLSRKVSDLNQAVGLMGVNPLKMLVLGFSLPRSLFEGLEKQALANYWRRTLTKAAAARVLSERAFHGDGDEAFVAGLLQDIGQLVLMGDLGQSYLEFLDRAVGAGDDLPALELAALGFDHAMLSARLLDRWGLPRGLIAAIAEPLDAAHLTSLPDDVRELPQTLHLADLAARVLADQQSSVVEELIATAHTYGDLSPAEVEEVLLALGQTVGELAEAFDVELSEPVDVARLLEEAQARRAKFAVGAFQEWELAADETRLKQEAERLRQAAAEFLSIGQRATNPTAGESPFARSKGSRPTVPCADPGLQGSLRTAVSRCRQRRTAVSVLAIAIDRVHELTRTAGPYGVRDAVQLVMSTANALDEAHHGVWNGDGETFSLVLEDCDRLQAVALARRLVETVSQTAACKTRVGQPFTISAGVATLALPPHNFPSQELIEAAWRCLAGAGASGGNVAKSIDIC